MLAERGLDEVLFDEVTRQFKIKTIRVKIWTLVDATIIASARKADDEARWVKHKGRQAMHGFKAHVGADADTSLVEQVSITPANAMMAELALSLYRMPLVKCSPIAPIVTIISEMRSAPRVGPPVSSSPMYGQALRMRRRRLPAWMIITGPFLACVEESKKYLEPGSAARVYAECDIAVSPKPPFKSVLPPSPTTSNAPSIFFPKNRRNPRQGGVRNQPDNAKAAKILKNSV